MEYQHGPYPTFPMVQGQQTGMYFQPHLEYNAFDQPTLQADLMHPSYGYPDFTGGPYIEDYEDNNEVSTRPRLSKEQVSVLEDTFQANPKPNSATKRQLAVHTQLSLPRVANWFQNRRAKAKQQRKQEEFENTQRQPPASTDEDTSQCAVDDEYEEEDKLNTEQERGYEVKSQEGPAVYARDTRSRPVSSPPCSPKCRSADAERKERSWASLQRAINAGRAAAPMVHDPAQQTSYVGRRLGMPPPLPRHSPMQSFDTSPHAQVQVQQQGQQLDWCTDQHAAHNWAAPVGSANDMAFDFGFDTATTQVVTNGHHVPSPSDTSSQSFVLSPNTWNASLVTPTMGTQSQHNFPQPLLSPGLPALPYSESRSGSIADALTNNFDSIALAGQTSQASLQLSDSASSNASEAGVDIASRRRRPRPAALTSASLRSRSFGAPSAASPTFKQGMVPPTAQPLRHAKSTGHSLNSHYAGIRKSSIPQKSPLNVASFVESDGLAKLLAQTSSQINAKQELTAMNNGAINQLHPRDQILSSVPQLARNKMNIAEIPQRAQMQSPPVTPYQQDFMLSSVSMMPPSIRAQYAKVSDYTPPYSAGPMTNSSWSDAPLTSPDFVNFPQVTYVPSLPYECHNDNSSSIPWVFSSDVSPRPTVNKPIDQRMPEFHMQKFPNQEEEHAQAAQLLNHQKPRHFASTIAFEHTKPEDFARQL